MIVNMLAWEFDQAQRYVQGAIEHLQSLRSDYATSDLPNRKARMRSLDAKIDALQAVRLDPEAHPWVGDWS